jgi:hypothetical protein
LNREGNIQAKKIADKVGYGCVHLILDLLFGNSDWLIQLTFYGCE